MCSQYARLFFGAFVVLRMLFFKGCFCPHRTGTHLYQTFYQQATANEGIPFIVGVAGGLPLPDSLGSSGSFGCMALSSLVRRQVFFLNNREGSRSWQMIVTLRQSNNNLT